jgi:hypothetical protein
LIQVRALSHGADGGGFFHLGHRDDPGTRKLIETLARVREMRRPVT